MVGIDEVGRGCWAGPLLVVAARAESALPNDLKDSKILSKTQRIILFKKLKKCCSFGEGWVESVEIDRFGLADGLKLGVQRALNDLGVKQNEEIILDGKINYIPVKFINSKTLIRADNLIPIVSAASIYAKVKRDAYMTQLSIAHPLYGFEDHVGYGTKRHIEALARHGVLDSIHRLTFAPIAKILA